MEFQTGKGSASPLGATVMENGVNFSVFSKNATDVELLFFDDVKSPYPSKVIQLDNKVNKTFYYWHIFVEGIQSGQLYGYRVYGPNEPENGNHFDGQKILLDPYAKAVTSHLYSRKAAKHLGDNCAKGMRSVVVNMDQYDWEDDQIISNPYSRTVIYEMHVGGFTKHPNSKVDEKIRGTYLGLIEKIPYLQELGVTAVELLPVQQFDAQETPNILTNYWGYSPIGFFAPHDGYCANPDNPVAVVDEFRDMVKALHKANIEVIIDVVFNHSAEGDSSGAVLSFKGLENKAYYSMKDGRTYDNYSGTGNTLNANNSIVRRMIIDSLRYWVQELHVDGFRFDLASVMSRDNYGVPLEDPPVLWEIESDPILSGTKIIAEAWDAAGLYQVGSFIGHRWAEWNGKYRDDIKRFIKGDNGTLWHFAKRIEGSHDMFDIRDRDPNRSINFITCHDGFTLNDNVSYNEKHNEANLENNRDGMNDNHSWNCGVEGATNDISIEETRVRLIKNFFTILMCSQGTPMLLMGDEVRRTQQGNNNVYCQDNELSWMDWDLVEQNQPLLRFVKKMIRFNLDHEVFQEEQFWHLLAKDGIPRVVWHGVENFQPDWGYQSHATAFMLTKPTNDENLLILVNAYWENLEFEIPEPLINHGMASWFQLVDTAMPSPHDFLEQPKPLDGATRLLVKSRSIVILKALTR